MTFLDSSALNVLISAQKRVTLAGGWIRLEGLRAAVARVVQPVGLDSIIACYPTVDQALVL
ncbi:STAS domain-containing protein [Streptomyces sp. NPDC001914]|uniref:STAS domain-containing protein n=1 Tax=Streptomyces sp. NPDC001914 TaxID=3364623 RepID=UPI0036B05640